VRPVEEPEANHEAYDPGDERIKSKRILSERECGRGHPDQRNEEAEPRESQKDDLLPALAILHDFDAATPLAVRCPNGNHHDARGDDHRLGNPWVHR
jgi:hypothetical protein